MLPKEPKVAMELTVVVKRPVTEASLTPILRPRAGRGLRSSRLTNAMRGKAPASRRAISPTVRSASSTGARREWIVKPVSFWIKPARSPATDRAVMHCPNTVNTRMVIRSQSHSPRAMRAAGRRVGSRFRSTFSRGMPAASPPARMPRGMVMMPHRMPLAA